MNDPKTWWRHIWRYNKDKTERTCTYCGITQTLERSGARSFKWMPKIDNRCPERKYKLEARRTCKTCGETYVTTDGFYKSACGRGGYAIECKKCKIEKQAVWNKKLAEREKACNNL